MTEYPGVETADIIPVASNDPEYGYWKSQILTHAPEICKRTFQPHADNPDDRVYEGVKVDHVRDTIAQYAQERHYIYVAATRTATRSHKYGRCRQLHAFAVAKDQGDCLYLDVVCAREAKSAADKRLKWGYHLLNNFEAHAKRLKKTHVLLSSLNLWLVENYYAPRGYVERDYPWHKYDKRKPVYSMEPSPRDMRMSRANLLKAAATRGIEGAHLTDQELRDELERRTWCGFRMTRSLEDVPATPSKAGAKLLRHSSGTPSRTGTPATRTPGTPPRAYTPRSTPTGTPRKAGTPTPTRLGRQNSKATPKRRASSASPRKRARTE